MEQDAGSIQDHEAASGLTSEGFASNLKTSQCGSPHYLQRVRTLIPRLHKSEQEPHRHHDHRAQHNIADEIFQRIEHADKGPLDEIDHRAHQFQRMQLESRQHKAHHQRQDDQPNRHAQRRVAQKAFQAGSAVAQCVSLIHRIWIAHSAAFWIST